MQQREAVQCALLNFGLMFIYSSHSEIDFQILRRKAKDPKSVLRIAFSSPDKMFAQTSFWEMVCGGARSHKLMVA